MAPGRCFTFSIFRACLVIVTSAHLSSGYRVLLIPQVMRSHISLLSHLGAALYKEGHEPYMLVPRGLGPKDSMGLSQLHYSTERTESVYDSAEVNQHLVRIMLANSGSEHRTAQDQLTRLVTDSYYEDCVNFFTDAELGHHIRSLEFDVAVVDSVGWPCLMMIPVFLDLPYILFSIPHKAWFYRAPDPPSFVPSSHTLYTDRMSFLERLDNTVRHLSDLWRYDTANPFYTVARQDIRERYKSADYVIEQALLWFVLEDVTLSYPRPYMPNMIPVGDLMARPATPLPEELRRFMDSSPEGVLLVSFGSVIDVLPSSLTDKFCGAFRRLQQKVIWRSKNADVCRAERVRIIDWVPQNDLLGHPNLRLLVTHGGLASIVEALYHVTPVLVVAMTTEQPRNSLLVRERSYGASLDVRDFTEDGLLHVIRDLLKNDTVERELLKASQILKNKPETVSRRVSYWVDHVMRHGNDHLRSSGSFDLGVFQYYLVDVYLFLVVALSLCVITFAGICLWLLACLCNCGKPTKLKQQ